MRAINQLRFIPHFFAIVCLIETLISGGNVLLYSIDPISIRVSTSVCQGHMLCGRPVVGAAGSWRCARLKVVTHRASKLEIRVTIHGPPHPSCLSPLRLVHMRSLLHRQSVNMPTSASGVWEPTRVWDTTPHHRPKFNVAPTKRAEATGRKQYSAPLRRENRRTSLSTTLHWNLASSASQSGFEDFNSSEVCGSSGPSPVIIHKGKGLYRGWFTDQNVCLYDQQADNRVLWHGDKASHGFSWTVIAARKAARARPTSGSSWAGSSGGSHVGRWKL